MQQQQKKQQPQLYGWRSFDVYAAQDGSCSSLVFYFSKCKGKLDSPNLLYVLQFRKLNRCKKRD